MKNKPDDKGEPDEVGRDQDQEQRPRADRPTYALVWDEQNRRMLAPIVGPDSKPPDELPAATESVKDNVAKSYFDEPRWQLKLVLRWIAVRKIEALALSDEDFRRLRHSAILLKGKDDVLVSKNPAADLLEALRTGDTKAIGPDHKDLPPEAWDTVLSHDLRTWPAVRFRRENVLKVWPSLEPLDQMPTGAGGSARHETLAIRELTAILRQEPDIGRTDAKARLTKYSLSGKGFASRVWPSARKEAGLDPRARPGRKRRPS